MTSVKLITALFSIVGIKLVSESFSLEQYGTYAQAILIITTVTSFTIMGMTDGVNYCFNNTTVEESQRHASVSTLFGLQTIVGGLGGIIILACGPLFNEYFRNPALGAVYIWIAFQPLLTNYLPMLQNLYISVGKTKLIVLRNLIIAIFRLGVFAWACFITHSIVTILAACFIFDALQTAYFWILLRRYGIKISLRTFDLRLVSPILKFCIPMAVFVVLNSLLRDIDKWIVGFLGDTDQVAIYTNCSRVLPFDILTASLATVLIPVITRNISFDKPKIREIFRHYLNLCLITTSILILPAVILSKDLLITLYARDYLPGLWVFIIYLFVDFLRFANLSIIFSASGRARALMKIATMCLAVNFILAVVLYKLAGFSGPALATLFTMGVSSYMFFSGGGRILDTNIFSLIDLRRFGLICFEAFILACIYFLISRGLSEMDEVLRFFSFYIPMTGLLVLFNRKPIISLLKAINRFR